MQYITKLDSFCGEYKTAVTMGKFDGFHRGHQTLIKKVKEYTSQDVKSMVFAFDMNRQSLMTNEERKTYLEDQVDYLIECPFTKEIREMKAEDFIKDIIVDKCKAAYVVIGTDFRFGHGKRGDADMLARYAQVYGYHLDVLEKARYEDRVISSSYVKEALQQGDITLANTLLGYKYRVSGKVEHGKKLGRRLGFPTMNIAPMERKLVPKYGVYTCQVIIDGVTWRGIGNVGVKPTVTNEPKLLIEVYVFDYEEDAYGKEIEVCFCRFEREEKKFTSIEALKAQLEKDILSGRQYFDER